MSEYDYMMFKSLVGEGNVSASLRNYIKASISTQDKNSKEPIIRKRFQLIQKDKEKLDKKYSKLKAELDAIDEKRKQQEFKRLEELEKQKEKASKIEGNTLRANLANMIPQ